MNQTEVIYTKLKSTARRLFHIGYGTTTLAFLDGSLVRLSDWEPSAYEEIDALLAQGEMPLGFIARLRNGFAAPLVCPWTKGDEQARVTLCSLAKLLYGHRMRRLEETT